MATAVWHYRHFILASIKREFQAKYSKSLLGMVWMLITPLYMIILYTILFSNVMRAGLDKGSYVVYVTIGYISWNLFSELLLRSQEIYLSHANLIKKLNFPHACLPLIVGINALINYCIILALFLLSLLILHRFPGGVVLFIIPVLIIQIFFSLGLGIILGIVNVFFRDVGQSMQILFQIWFWLTPIVYLRESLPTYAQNLVLLNPLTGLVNAYQRVFLYHEPPSLPFLLYPSLMAFLFCFISYRFYRKNIDDLLDEL